MTGIKTVGMSANKFNQGIESLARTDDMLAWIGIVMLVSVILSSYGEFWQGRLARAQFKDECTADNPPTDDTKASKRFLWVMVGVSVLLIALLVWIFRKQIKDKLTGK